MEPGSWSQFSKTPPPLPVPGHINPIHTLQLYFYILHFNIILPSGTKSSEWSLRFRLETNILRMTAKTYL
jgi:hypothetical protein